MATKAQLYYDTSCPICGWYSQKFVDVGVLEPQGRCNFNDAEDLMISGELDAERAKNYIPLYNPETGETHYGLDTILHLLGLKWKWMERIGRIKPIYWISNKAYRFVSFNRRIAMPTFNTTHTNDMAAPGFNAKYRWLFILFAVAVSILVTLGVSRLFMEKSATIFWSIGAGWILYFVATKIILDRTKWFDLLSHTAFVMLRGVLIFALILPMWLVPYGFLLAPVLVGASFLDMNIQMRKRVRHLELSISYYYFWMMSLIGSMTIVLITQL